MPGSGLVLLLQGLLQRLRIMRSTKKRFNILNGLSGTIRPGRLTLLLGPPSSGKTTLLKALSGKLRGTGLKVCAALAHAVSSHAQQRACYCSRHALLARAVDWHHALSDGALLSTWAFIYAGGGDYSAAALLIAYDTRVQMHGIACR